MNLGLLLIPALGGEPDFAITPVVSGYRDGETRELRITRNYLPALRQSQLGVTEFRIVIPHSQIASARRIDPHAYELLHRTNTGEPATTSSRPTT